MSKSDSPGPELRAARERLGLSVREVATSLKVPTEAVSSIEDEQFDALPARVFTRAYLRSYAELVGLDADALLWAYDQKTNPEEMEEVEARRSGPVLGVVAALMRDAKQHPLQSWVFGGTVVLFAALAGLFLWFAWPSDAPTAPVPAEERARDSLGRAVQPASPADDVPAPVPNEPPAIDPPFAPSETAVSDSSPAARPDPRPIGPADGLPDSAPNGADEGLVPLSNPLTYVPGDEHVLSFRFTQDCWVKVFDASGTSLHGDLERAGDELQVRGEAPFRITLGYAPGVQLEYNGERVMLAQHTNDSDVAELVLGL